MGRFTVEMEVANNDDLVAERLGNIDSSKVRRFTIQGLVDPGATNLVLPQEIATRLGLPPAGTVKVRYADGRTAKKKTVDNVYVEILGRHGVFTATVEPKRETALIGAIILETFDLLVDCHRQQLVPRDPDYIVAEIE